jgi:hypothetical protein
MLLGHAPQLGRAVAQLPASVTNFRSHSTTPKPTMKYTELTRRGWLIAATSMAIARTMSSWPVSFAWAEQPNARPVAIRGEIVLPRASHDWMSQQVEEPFILANPKVPGRLIMFYSAVSSSNRVVAAIGKAWADTRNPFRWHQVFKVGATYVLCIEVGVNHGARWRPGLAVSRDPVQGWTQLDLDTMLQTKWTGLYDDRTLYHVATPALYLIDRKWYLFAQACGRPANDNYIDGAWEMWCIACDRVIPTRSGCAQLYTPGEPAQTVGTTRK